jgi:hypothetical protein
MGSCISLNQQQYAVKTYRTTKEIDSSPGWSCVSCAADVVVCNKVLLAEDEYIIIQNPVCDNNKKAFEIISGPVLYVPKDPYEKYVGNITKKTKLTKREYIIIEDIHTGEKGIIEGEAVFVKDPYINYSNIKNKIMLNKNEYITITDTKTGEKSNISGPLLYTPSPYDEIENEANPIKKKLDLTNTNYVKIKNKLTGDVRIEIGPNLLMPGIFDEVSRVETMISLNETQYIYITHTNTGVIDIVEGPQIMYPGPYDTLSPIQTMITLTQNEYVKIKDNKTGQIRVEKGPAKVILKQYENKINDICKAYEINEHNAVLIRNIDNGSYELITAATTNSDNNDKNSMNFYPSATQEVVEQRKKIILEKYEIVVVIDKTGKHNIMRGSDDTRSFFLPPYCKLLTQDWSNDIVGITRNQKLKQSDISKFDTRPQYMDFDFTIRTLDNVEITVCLNFYWQILDIQKMIEKTSDAPEDICRHIMSQVLSFSSKKDMKEFMSHFNEIIQTAINKNDPFFDERGIAVHRIEIIGRKCKDETIESLFQHVIEEKAKRIRNKESQEAQNDCILSQLTGEIEAEKKRGELSRVKETYTHDLAKLMGLSEGDKLAQFLKSLPEELSWQEKLSIWKEQEHTKRMELLVSKVGNIVLAKDEADFWLSHHNITTNTREPINPIVNLVPSKK